MTRGDTHLVKVHYRGKGDDFVIYVESAQAVRDWKKDRSTPMTQVVDGYKVFVTHKHGAQGILDGASNAQLDSEFGTHKIEDVMEQILENGEIQETKRANRLGDRNPNNGPGISSMSGLSGNVHN